MSKSTSHNTRHFAESQRCKITLPCRIPFGKARSTRRVIAGKSSEKPKPETPKQEKRKSDLPLFLIAEREEFLRNKKAAQEQKSLEERVFRKSLKRWPMAHDAVEFLGEERLGLTVNVDGAMAVHAERAWQETEAA